MKLKKIFFMGKKFLTDIQQSRQIYSIYYDNQSNVLGYYYFLIDEEGMKSGRYQALIKAFDQDGIPLNAPYIDVEDKNLDYYPISIGQYGLSVFHTYLDTNSEQKKLQFLKIADWFYNNHIQDKRLGVFWETRIPKPEYKIFKPWKSAFTQSRALSVLLRAWQLTGQTKYLDLSKKALIPFMFDIRDDGVAAFRNEGHPFYEEYVATEPTMVLDGHIFSLLGLYDFVRAVPETLDTDNYKLSHALFDEGIDSILYWFPKFDMGFWLKFNLCKMEHYPDIDPCTIGYLRLIRSQLQLLHEITSKDEFKLLQLKIQQYDHVGNILKMYPYKYKALKKLKRL
jgi:hypothetical protein